MKTILVTDDHVEANRLLCRLLATIGYRVVSALTGADALAAIAAEVPDLLILDLMMPELDGFEVLQRLRRDPATATLPVIVYSALDDEQSQEQARLSGATAYFVKGSTDCGQLMKMVAGMLTEDEHRCAGAAAG